MDHSVSDEPKQLGDFQVLARIGQGGMGTVYRAMQISMGRQVALKCLTLSGDADAKARFLQEIQALGMVSHPHLVKVFASGTVTGQSYFAMEFIDGTDLASVSDALRGMHRPVHQLGEKDWFAAFETAVHHAPNATAGTLSGETELESQGDHSDFASPARVSSSSRGYAWLAADVIRQVAEAASALHQAKIVHRDIKPGNIMVRTSGTDAVLMDLGLAHISRESENRLTRTQQFVGTLRYASPEQVLSADKVDARSDVYSLGATLWELLTLSPLYGTDNNGSTFDLMKRIEFEDPPSVRDVNPTVPLDLAAIVSKCLQKNPRRRYQTAAELAADLKSFIRGDLVTARPLTALQRSANIISRHPLHAAAVALIVIASFLMMTVFSIRIQLASQRSHNHELSLANERADRSFRDAVQSLNSIFDLITDGELRHIPELRPLQKRLLDYYEGYIQQHDGGVGYQLDIADARARIGRIRQESGNTAEALADYAVSLQLSRNVLRDDPRSLAAVKAIGNVLIASALLLLDQREYSGAAQHLLEAGKLLDETDSQDDAGILRLHAEVHHTEGMLAMENGKVTESLRHFLESIRFRDGLFKIDPGPLSQRDVGRGYGYLGDVQVEIGDYAAALQSYTTSLKLRDEISQKLPESHEAKFQLARAYRNLGYLSQLRRHLPDALMHYKRAVAIQRQLRIAYPAIAIYTSDFAIDSGALGELLIMSGDVDTSITTLQEARDVALALLERSPTDMAVASSAFQSAVFLAKAERMAGQEKWKADLIVAERLSTGLKESSANDLFNRALLARIRQPLSMSGNLKSQNVGNAAEFSEVSVLLEKAVRESPHTILARIKREEVFDAFVVSAPGSSTAATPRGMKLDQAAAQYQVTKLYGLCIGISVYQDDSLHLKWAKQDAVELSEMLKVARETREVTEVRQLIDHEATREKILESLGQLRQQTDDASLCVLHFSGHGLVNALGEYYFAPFDFNPGKGVSTSALSWYDIEQEVKRMRGIKLIILDTCHSGAVVTGGMRGVLAGTMDRTAEEILQQIGHANTGGVVVLSSALTGQASLETDEWGHGPLTLSVIEALANRRIAKTSTESAIELPASVGSKGVTLEAVRNYSVARVNELTSGRQRVITRNSVDMLDVFLKGAK